MSSSESNLVLEEMISALRTSFYKVDFFSFWAKGILTDVLTSKRWFPVNAGEKSSAPFLDRNV